MRLGVKRNLWVHERACGANMQLSVPTRANLKVLLSLASLVLCVSGHLHVDFMAFTGAFVSNGLLGGASSDGDSPFGSNDMEFTSNGLLGGSILEDKAMIVEAVDEGSNSDGMLLDEDFISNGLLGGVNVPGGEAFACLD